MKPALVILAGLLIYQSANVVIKEKQITDLKTENTNLKRDNKHLTGQLQKANDQVLEWNSNYLARDYAKRNGIKYLKIVE